MLMQYCQIAKSKKGGMGLSDFFSILAFVLILLVFYLIMKFTIGKIVFSLPSASKNIEDSIALMSILKTPVNVNNIETDIAGLITLSKSDSSKTKDVENILVQIIEKSYGRANCAIFCINERQIKSKGCETLVGTQACSDNVAFVPGYDGIPIKLSFISNVAPLNLQFAP